MALETLSDSTRKVRKGLLASSLIGYAISRIGVSISKVSVFGTEIKIGNFEAIPFVLGMIIIYYLITFISYSISEYSHSSYETENQSFVTSDIALPANRREAKKTLSRIENEVSTLEEEANKADSETASKLIEVRIVQHRKILAMIDGRGGEARMKYLIRFKKLILANRTLVEFSLPIVLGIYCCISVMLYSDFKVDPPKAVRPAVTIQTEKVMIQQHYDSGQQQTVPEPAPQNLLPSTETE